jgi:hypothetical protein
MISAGGQRHRQITSSPLACTGTRIGLSLLSLLYLIASLVASILIDHRGHLHLHLHLDLHHHTSGSRIEHSRVQFKLLIVCDRLSLLVEEKHQQCH